MILDEADKAVTDTFRFPAMETGWWPTRHGTAYYEKTLDLRDAGAITLIKVQPGDRSNLPTAILATEVLIRRRPEYVFLVDIAGGVAPKGKDADGNPPALIEDDVLLGDVVVSTFIHYPEYCKEDEGGTVKYRDLPLQQPSTSLHEIARVIHREAEHDNWWADIPATSRPAKPPMPRYEPRLHLHETISGERLLGDPASLYLLEILAKYDRARAVDMESAGLARAVYQAHRKPLYAVIRGISDYCNRPANQETREKWKKYAAQTAAAVAYQLAVRTVDNPAKLVSRYWDGAKAWLADQRGPGAVFDTTVSVLGRSANTQEGLTTQQLKDLLLDRHRLMLTGSPGTGKTEILQRIASAVAPRAIPIYIAIDSTRCAALDGITGNDSRAAAARLDVLLRQAAVPADSDLLRLVPKARQVVFLVDGLNEVGPLYIKEIIDTIDDYLQNHPGHAAILTDRTAQRQGFTLPGWLECRVDPLKEEEINKVVAEFGSLADATDEERELLVTPFHLNQALQLKTVRLRSASKAHKRFFNKQLKLTPEGLAALSEAAFEAYSLNHGRKFSWTHFKATAREETARLLLEGQLLAVSDGLAMFAHQLYHDYLAAVYVAKHERWEPEDLDAITFYTASPEILTIVLEMLRDATKGDKFIRAVYDWSWSKAIRLAGKAGTLQPRRCTPELEMAFAAINAERRFDKMRRSSEAATEAARGFTTAVTRDITQQETPSSLLQAVGRCTSNVPWFLTWRALFRGELEMTQVCDHLLGDDSLLGWTASAVLGRVPSAVPAGRLAAAYRELLGRPGKEAQRWRIVHTLGRAEEPIAIAILAEALRDAYIWVQYGAARSLVEQAARTRDKARRRDALKGLREALNQLPALALGEGAEATLYIGAAPRWPAAAQELLAAIDDRYQATGDKLGRRRIEELKTKLEAGETGHA